MRNMFIGLSASKFLLLDAKVVGSQCLIFSYIRGLEPVLNFNIFGVFRKKNEYFWWRIRMIKYNCILEYPRHRISIQMFHLEFLFSVLN